MTFTEGQEVTMRERSLLILGLGNVLCADDGLGVVAVRRLVRGWVLPDGARALDGGTLGLSLLTHIRDSDDLILVDAIGGDGPAGTFVRLEGEEVAPAVRARLSVHQIGVADLLDSLRLLDDDPRRVILLGLVPESLELSVRLSPPVRRALPRLVREIVEEARRLGHRPREREPDDESADLDPVDLALGVR